MRKVLGLLLAIWLVLTIIGFAVKALLWLGFVGIVLILITLIIGFVFQRTPKA